MKTKSNLGSQRRPLLQPRWLLASLVLILPALTALSADQFVKITEGPVVTDQANYFGGSWADYDDDGFIDLFVPAGVDVVGQAPAFYHNIGGTSFFKLTANEVGSVVATWNMPNGWCKQGLWADFNNDGHLDLLEIGSREQASPLWWYSSNRLFLGRSDHTFEWVTADVGVNPPEVESWQCALVDFDNDGALDIHYTTGWVYSNTRDSLYRNQGNGTFAKAWSPTGTLFETQFACWGDYDNDGDSDLWLLGFKDWVNFASVGQFYRNNGDGTFSGDLTGVEIPSVTSFLGVWGDYDNDRFLDFLNGSTLFHNNGSGGFTVARNAHLIGGIGRWGDFDNDGDLDAVIGHWDRQPCQFYRNEGGGWFTSVDLGAPSHDVPANESIPSLGDYNNDGFLDLFIGTRGNPVGSNYLYRNSGLAGGNQNHWLIVKPKGIRSNRAGIGAKVRIEATIRGAVTWQMREITGGFDDLRAHFGLGDATTITKLRIEWPYGGLVQEFSNVPANQILTIEEGRPVMMAPVLQPGGAIQFQLNGGLVGTQYVTESRGNLSTPANWTPVSTNTGPTTPIVVPAAPAADQRFLRVKQQ